MKIVLAWYVIFLTVVFEWIFLRLLSIHCVATENSLGEGKFIVIKSFEEPYNPYSVHIVWRHRPASWSSYLLSAPRLKACQSFADVAPSRRLLITVPIHLSGHGNSHHESMWPTEICIRNIQNHKVFWFERSRELEMKSFIFCLLSFRCKYSITICKYKR